MQIVAERTAHPEIAAGSITRPIFIVGQARSGTTILHDLLAQDPTIAAACMRGGRQAVPAAPEPGTAAGRSVDHEEVDASLAMVDLVIPGFRAMHPMGARLAQECVRITAADFRSMIFATQYRVPSYAAWLIDEADMSSAYRWHRTFLQHLQSRSPAARWVLKSPGHIWCLGALMAEYPDAVIVQTHRDPLRIVALLSFAGHDAAIARQRLHDHRVGGLELADLIIEGVDRSVTDRDDGTVPAGSVVDTQFAAFMADPFAAIAEIYERLGLSLTSEAEDRMRAFLASNAQDKHGGHTYTWAATGLDEAALRARSKRYEERFAVPVEALS